jgi:hypothetical protein
MLLWKRAEFAMMALVCILPFGVSGQAPTLEVEPGIAYQTHYPERLNQGCGSGFGIVPSARLRYRAGRWMSIEVDVAGQFEVKTERQSGCGIALPPIVEGTQTGRAFDISGGSPSVVTAAKAVLTPVDNQHGSFRVVIGTGWYWSRSTPAWLWGVGMGSRTSWGAITVDVERWNLGVPYRLVRETYNPAGNTYEVLADHREWSRHWQFRLGIAVWSP